MVLLGSPLYIGLISLLSIYTSLLCFLLFHRRVARLRFRQWMAQERDAEAVSLAWAWLSVDDVLAAMQYWGEFRFPTFLTYPRPSFKKLAIPWYTFTIGAIVIYQYLLRSGDPFGCGDCKSIPNCSNYAIGTLFRRHYFFGVLQAYVRVKTCTVGDRVSFREDHS